jgi:hypothetical protein
LFGAIGTQHRHRFTVSSREHGGKEKPMRIMLACTLALSTMIGAANAADFEPPAPGYGGPPPAYSPPRPYGYAPPPVYVPPQRYGYAPPPAYAPPPRYSYAPPPAVYGPPPVLAYGPPRAVPVPPPYYAGPPPYPPGDEYAEVAPEVEGPAYYRECWVEWGQRRCRLKPRW